MGEGRGSSLTAWPGVVGIVSIAPQLPVDFE